MQKLDTFTNSDEKLIKSILFQGERRSFSKRIDELLENKIDIEAIIKLNKKQKDKVLNILMEKEIYNYDSKSSFRDVLSRMEYRKISYILNDKRKINRLLLLNEQELLNEKLPGKLDHYIFLYGNELGKIKIKNELEKKKNRWNKKGD